MTLLIDPPNATGHGRCWSHLASDSSFDELHAFARSLGLPARGFDRDHYDVPEEWYARIVAAGARPVSSRELIDRLLASGLRRRKAQTPAPRRPGAPLLVPPRLREGDTVAVVAPAGPTDPGRLAAGVRVLESWGLRVRVPEPGAGGAPLHAGWLAGSDEQRARAFTEAWTDPEVRAVIATRGGSGSTRMLRLLDWDRLAAAGPKLLVGFSDVTAVHQAVAQRLGLATVHGPVVASLGDGQEGARAWARQVLFGAAPEIGALSPVVPGRAEGVLVGGNLTVLAAGVGTPYCRPAAGGIVLLEDVGERPWRLDRALTQLLSSGWFDEVRGVLLGQFVDCGAPDEVEAVLHERLGGLGVPVAAGAAVGHGPENLTLPLGLPAVLDCAPRAELVVTRPLR